MYFQKTKLLLATLIIVFSSTTFVFAGDETRGFIENKGQFAEKSGRVRNDINFKFEQAGINAYFKPDGIIYHFYQSIEKSKEDYTKEDLDNYKKGDWNAIDKKVHFFRLDLNLINSNTNASYEAEGIQQMKYNYYLGHCPQGITNVNSFNEITYKNIYPNIDIRYYFLESKLKYEFIVHPGGDIKNIQFKYNGANSTKIIAGKLIVENEFNTITEDQPYSYCKETNQKIESNFKIENGIVSFDLENYNPNQTIVIDPTITWASYYNNTSSSDFHANSVFDSQGNIYTAFATYSATWPVINAGGSQYFDAIKDGSLDLVIARINANYSKQWATYYGGNGSDVLCGTGGDYGKTIVVDGNDDVYVGGKTSGSNVFPTQTSGVPGAFYQDQTKLYGGDTPFLLKFNGNGVRQWATMFQHEQANTSSAGMRINGICAKGTKIYFTGETYRFNNNDMPLRVLAGAYNNSTFVGDQDIFIGRFDSNCLLEWSTYFNGGNNLVKGYKQGTDLHVDAAGNLLFVGQISGSAPANGASAYLLNPGGGAYYAGTIAGNADIQIAKFNPSMQPVWSTHYGSNDLDRVSEVSSDINNNILVACRTVSGTGFPTANPGGAFCYTTKQAPGTWSSNGAQDGAVMKFTPAGVLYWATYIGGTSSTTNSTPGIASDNSGNIYVIGYTNTNNFPTQNLAGSYNQAASAGGNDIVLMKFTPTGGLTWSSYYGGSVNESCYGIKITPSSKHGVCGYYKQFNVFSSDSPNNIPTVNPGGGAFYEPTKPTSSSSGVLLIEELSTAGVSTPPTGILGTTTICIPNSTTLTINGGALASGSAWTWHTGGCTGPVVGTGASISVSPTTTTTYYVNAIGTCDTTICVSVTVNVSANVTGSFSQNICSGNSYLFNGQNLTTSGAYLDTLTAAGGCDSIVTLNLSVTPNVSGSFSQSICSGNSYLFNGQNLTTSGTYLDTLTANGGGCDSIVTLTLSITPNVSGNYSQSICTGTSYLFNGQNLTTTGAYLDTIAASSGCDSIVTLNLIVTNPLTSSFNQSICTGSSYLFNGQNLTIAGTYLDTLTAMGGCDSIVTLNLSVTPNVTGNFSQTICTGNSYLFNGQNLTTTGAYYDTLTTTGGCDSIVTLNLTVTPSVSGNYSHTICAGTSYLFNGQNLITAGAYYDTLSTTGGCDSIVTLNLSLLPNANSIQNITACSSSGYTLPNGTTIYSSGIFKDTVAAYNGCDSIINYNITINTSPSAAVSPDVTIIQGTNTTLTAIGFGTYNWSPSTGLDTTMGTTVIAQPNVTTTYCVIVTNPNGCSDTACVTVTVESSCASAENLVVPNAFSPNGDGVNDEYCLQGWNTCIKDFSIVIYNRWGEKVFETKDPNFCWDGIYKNVKMDAQVFVYYINATHVISGEKFIRNGNISLIR